MANDVTKRVLIQFEAKMESIKNATQEMVGILEQHGQVVGKINEKYVQYATTQRDASGRIIKDQKAVIQVLVDTKASVEELNEAMSNINPNLMSDRIKATGVVIRSILDSETESVKKNNAEQAKSDRELEIQRRKEAKETAEVKKIATKTYVDNEREAAKQLQNIFNTFQKQVATETSAQLAERKVYANTIRGIEQKLADDILAVQKNLSERLKEYQLRISSGTGSLPINLLNAQQAAAGSTSQINSLIANANTARQALVDRQAREQNYRQEAENYRQIQRQILNATNERLQMENLAIQRNGGQRAVLLQQQANREAAIRANYASQIRTYETALQLGFISSAQANQYATNALNGMQESLRSSRSALEQHLNGLDTANTRTQSLGFRIFEIIGLYRIWNAVINATISALKQIPASGIEMQATQSALQASLSSNGNNAINPEMGAIRAAKAMQMLQEEANRTGIDILTLEKNYRTFLASATMAGESVNTATKIFKELNTTVMALHMSGDRVELTFLALAQMFNKGKIQSEELVKQLSNLLPGAVAAFAKANGKSVQDLLAEMKKGTVQAHDTISKFIEEYSKRYSSAFEFASQGYLANTNRMQTAWTNFTRAMFTLSEGALTSVVKLATGIVTEFTPAEHTINKLQHSFDWLKESIDSINIPKPLSDFLSSLSKQPERTDLMTSRPLEGLHLSELTPTGQAKALADEIEKQVKRIEIAKENLANTNKTISARGGSSLNPLYKQWEEEIKNLESSLYGLIDTSNAVHVKLNENNSKDAEESLNISSHANELTKAEQKALKDAAAIRKEILDNRLDELKKNSQLEQSLYNDKNRDLENSYKTGLISLQEYGARAAILDKEVTDRKRANIAEQMSLIQTEMDIQQQTLDSSKVTIGQSKLVTPEMKSQVSAQLAQYSEFIKQSAVANGVPEAILFAMMGQESGGQEGIVSKKGAQGLMQLLTGTFKEVMGNTDKIFDPQTNIEAGARYFAKMLDAYKGQSEQFLKALAAYNAGPGNVDKALQKAFLSGKSWQTYLPDETKNYIKAIPAKMEKLGITEQDITIVENYTTAIEGTSKAIEDNKGRYALLGKELQKVTQDQNDYMEKVKETARAEADRIAKKYATPDEIATEKVKTVRDLQTGVAGVKITDAQAQKELLAIEQERVKANQELVDQQNKLPDTMKTYLDLVDKVNTSYSSLGATSFDSLNQMYQGISKLITALDNLGISMQKNQDTASKEADAYAKAVFPTSNNADYEKMLKNQDKLKEQHIQAQIKSEKELTVMQVNSVRQVAAITGKFFGEKTIMRKAFNAIENTLSALETARTIEDTVKKLGLIDLLKAKDSEKAAQSVANATIETAASQTAGQAKAAEGVANEASGGDPYSAFARVAAMIALMASIGFMVGGGGGGASVNIAKERQDATGTGTILGDAKAKSESIGKSLERLKDNSDLTMPLSQGMLSALNAIKDSIGNLTGYLSRQLGITDGNYFSSGSKAGYSSVMPGGSAFSDKWGVTLGIKKELADFGITFNTDLYKTEPDKWKPQTFGELASGVPLRGQSYQDIKSTSSFGFFKVGSSLDRYRDVNGPMDAVIMEQFRKLLVNLGNTTIDAATSINKDYQANLNKLKDYKFELPDISFKDLTGDEITKQLQAWASQQGDKLATYLGDTLNIGLTDFQQAGEGLLETMVRVGTGIEKADVILWRYGLTIGKVADIQNKQGDVSLELFKTALSTVEGTQSGIGKIMAQFVGSVNDAADLYDKLISIRENMKGSGLESGNISYKTIQGAGSLENLAAGSDTYSAMKLSSLEIFQNKFNKLSESFIKAGQVIPTTTQQYLDLVESIDTSTEHGQKLQGTLVALAPLVDETNTAYQDSIDKAEALRKTHLDYSISLAQAGSSLSSIPNALSLVTEKFDKLAPALELITTAADAFLTESQKTQNAKDFWSGVAQAALDASPLLQSLGLKKDATYSDITRVAASKGITNPTEAYSSYVTGQTLAGQNPRLDPIVQYIDAIANRDKAGQTTANDLAKASDKQTDNSQKQLENAQKFAELQQSVFDSIKGFSLGTAEKKFQQVNKEIQDLSDSASKLGQGELQGLETLRTLRMGQANNELFNSMKPLLEMTNKLGYTNLDLVTAMTKDENGLWSFSQEAKDLIPSLVVATNNMDAFSAALTELTNAADKTKQSGMSDTAKQVYSILEASAKSLGVVKTALDLQFGSGDSPQKDSVLATLKNSTKSQIGDIFKPLNEELRGLGKTDYEKNLSALNTEMAGWNEALELAKDSLDPEKYREYAIAIQTVSDVRQKALKKDLEALMKDSDTNFQRRNATDFQNTLYSIMDRAITSIEGVIQAGGSLTDATTIYNRAITYGAEAATKARDEVVKAFRDIFKAITQTRSSVSDEITKLTNPNDLAGIQKARAMQEFNAAAALHDYQSQLDAINSIHSAIMDSYSLQIDNLNKMKDFSESISDYLKSMKLDRGTTILSPEKQLAEAKKQFDELFAKAKTGDQTALGKITDSASKYLDIAKLYYASTPEYADIFNTIQGDLSSLVGPIDYQQQIADATQKTVTELQNLYSLLDMVQEDQTSEQTRELQKISFAVNSILTEFNASVFSLEGLGTLIGTDNQKMLGKVSLDVKDMLMHIAVVPNIPQNVTDLAAEVSRDMNLIITSTASSTLPDPIKHLVIDTVDSISGNLDIITNTTLDPTAVNLGLQFNKDLLKDVNFYTHVASIDNTSKAMGLNTTGILSKYATIVVTSSLDTTGKNLGLDVLTAAKKYTQEIITSNLDTTGKNLQLDKVGTFLKDVWMTLTTTGTLTKEQQTIVNAAKTDSKSLLMQISGISNLSADSKTVLNLPASTDKTMTIDALMKATGSLTYKELLDYYSKASGPDQEAILTILGKSLTQGTLTIDNIKYLYGISSGEDQGTILAIGANLYKQGNLDYTNLVDIYAKAAGSDQSALYVLTANLIKSGTLDFSQIADTYSKATAGNKSAIETITANLIQSGTLSFAQITDTYSKAIGGNKASIFSLTGNLVTSGTLTLSQILDVYSKATGGNKSAIESLTANLLLSGTISLAQITDVYTKASGADQSAIASIVGNLITSGSLTIPQMADIYSKASGEDKSVILDITSKLLQSGTMTLAQMADVYTKAEGADKASIFSLTSNLVSSGTLSLTQIADVYAKSIGGDKGAILSLTGNLISSGTLTLPQILDVYSKATSGNKGAIETLTANLIQSGTLSLAQIADTYTKATAGNKGSILTLTGNLITSGTLSLSQILDIYAKATSGDKSSIETLTANLIKSGTLTLDEISNVYNKAIGGNKEAIAKVTGNLIYSGDLTLTQIADIYSKSSGGNKSAILGLTGNLIKDGTLTLTDIASIYIKASEGNKTAIFKLVSDLSTQGNISLTDAYNAYYLALAGNKTAIESISSNLTTYGNFSLADTTAVFNMVSSGGKSADYTVGAKRSNYWDDVAAALALTTNGGNLSIEASAVLTVEQTLLDLWSALDSGMTTIGSTVYDGSLSAAQAASYAERALNAINAFAGTAYSQLNWGTWNNYAEGGIANTPSIFGEAGPEAAVPLPDGRTIPVTLSGETKASSVFSKEILAEIKTQTEEIKQSRRENTQKQDAMIQRLAQLERRLLQLEATNSLGVAR